MIFKKGAPGLRRWPAAADHILGDCCLRHFDAKFEQFPVDSRRAPGCVTGAHLPDQISNLQGGIGSPSAAPTALPFPIQPKSLPVPGNHGFGLDHHEGRAPISPEAREPNPQESIGRIQSWSGRNRTSQDVDLMSQREDFSLECKARSADAKEGMNQRKHNCTHEPEASSLIPQVQFFHQGQSF